MIPSMDAAGKPDLSNWDILLDTWSDAGGTWPMQSTWGSANALFELSPLYSSEEGSRTGVPEASEAGLAPPPQVQHLSTSSPSESYKTSLQAMKASIRATPHYTPALPPTPYVIPGR